MKITGSILLVALLGEIASSPALSQERQLIWDEAVGGIDTVFMEEMTAGEIAAALRDGFTNVLVPTGGIEQNGPNVATGKHNIVLRATADAIARQHGKTLVSSIVQFVPEGDIEPPTGHMLYPGTISLRPETFEALLADICESLRQHGFLNIFLIGDSGGNREGMTNVAERLNKEWTDNPARVHHIEKYYSEDMWSFEYLKLLGYTQLPDEPDAFRNNIHTDLHYEAIMAVVDPETVRARRRFDTGGYEVHGVIMETEFDLVELGKALIDYRTDITVTAMQRAVSE